jgi:hypothetical protein
MAVVLVFLFSSVVVMEVVGVFLRFLLLFLPVVVVASVVAARAARVMVVVLVVMVVVVGEELAEAPTHTVRCTCNSENKTIKFSVLR